QHLGADMAAPHLGVVRGEEGRRDQEEDVELEVPGVRLVQEVAPDHLVGDDDAGGEDQHPGEDAGRPVHRPDGAAEAAPRPGCAVGHSTDSAMSSMCCPSLTWLAKSFHALVLASA